MDDRFKIFVDTETTGLLDFKLPADDPAQPRMASITLILDAPCGRTVNIFHSYVRPDGWSMPQGPGSAGAVNGLTDDFLTAHGKPIVDVLDIWNAWLSEHDPLVVAHNTTFDMKVIRGEQRRAGLPDRFEDVEPFCTMKRSTAICRVPGPRGLKWPNLGEAHKHFFGFVAPGAHGSLSDAWACRSIFYALLPHLNAMEAANV